MSLTSRPEDYFRHLDADAVLLGGTQSYETVRTVSQAVTHCRALGNLSLPDSSLHALSAGELHTTVGQVAHAALASGIRLAARQVASLACCMQAEEKLVAAIAPHAVANPKYASPVIVMHGDEPAAIWKGYGEQTAYGLKTVPEVGLVKGMFHAPVNGPYPKSQIRTTRALRVSSDNDLQFWPLRFGLAALPDTVRRGLEAPRSLFATLDTNHSQLQVRAAELAITALSLD